MKKELKYKAPKKQALNIPVVSGCYYIVLWTWHQEIPNELQEEPMKQYPFGRIEDAAIFLGENIDKLCEEFPISKVEIRYFNNR